MADSKNTDPQRAWPVKSLWTLWWQAIDRWILICALLLLIIGTWLVLAASPAIAAQHGWTTFILLKRHLIFAALGALILIGYSFMPKKYVLPIACGVIGASWFALWGVLLLGTSVKGAKRWLNIFGLSLQPSEFVKPAFCVLCAHFLACYSEKERYSRFLKVALLFVTVACPLLLQPDLGTVLLLFIGALTQSFIAGLSWAWIAGVLGTGLLTLIPILLCFPHAAIRLTSFLGYGQADPFGKQYQILQSLKSFSSGGLWGKGPGSGVILDHLPDSHADFIFAVAGEELGLFACLSLLALYGITIFRSFQGALCSLSTEHTFIISGLTCYLMYQVFLNIACALNLAPTKGITLPFLSYGGSSLMSACWTASIILCLTRRYQTLLK